MDIDFGEFKSIFVLDSVYGICTVSLTTLEQSKWKVTYSVTLLAVYVLEKIIIVYNGQTYAPFALKVTGLCSQTLPFYSLIMAVFDYKSKVSTALNLQSIQRQLESLGVTIPGISLLKVMSWIVLLTNIIFQCWGLFVNFFVSKPFLPFTRFVTTFQLFGTDMQQEFTLAMLLAKIAMIQKAVTKKLSEIPSNQERAFTTREQKPANQKRKSSKAKRENNKTWTLLLNIQGSLQDIENTTRNCFWVQLICYRLMIEVIGLVLCMSWVQVDLTAFSLINFTRRSIVFIFIVLTIVSINSKKKEASMKVNNSTKQDGGVPCSLRKRYMLAAIHRSASPFSCALFDVNYALLAAILENALFVVTSMMDASTDNP